jgi:hypothetical protein
MDRFETRKYYEKYTITKGIAYGTVAGIAAGLIMAPFLMVSAAAVGLPASSILVAIGLAFGSEHDNAMNAGIILHLLASALIGGIFGSVTSIFDSLRINGIIKGITQGLITGIIAFIVILIPIGILVLPPFLVLTIAMEIEIETTTTAMLEQEQIADMLQQVMPTLFGLFIVDHLIFGAVLGTIMCAFLVRIRKRSTGTGSE